MTMTESSANDNDKSARRMVGEAIAWGLGAAVCAVALEYLARRAQRSVEEAQKAVLEEERKCIGSDEL